MNAKQRHVCLWSKLNAFSTYGYYLKKKEHFHVFRNSAILQVGESSLQQENLEGYGQAKSTPPDLSNVEAFHSVTLRFAPKNVVFPFLGILCR